MTRRILLLLAATLTSSACMLGPDYERPPVTSPEAWLAAGAEGESIANTPWWEIFQDEQLQGLIRIALDENRDIRIAVERLEEARALYGITRSELYPSVDVSATVDRRGSKGGPESEVWAALAAVSWEPDFFGRVRRSTEAQMALWLATEEARRFVYLTLVSDVARAYMELRDFDRQLEISTATLASRREYVEMAKIRFEGGITAEIDYRQAVAEEKRTEAIVSDLERLIRRKENEISVLLGRNPGAVPRGRPIDAQALPASIPAGLPSELLDRRPDIRGAEQQLVAANANIGVAKALLWPRIALTGSAGLVSNDLGDLADSDSFSWNILGNLLQPIFNAGRNRRRVEATESVQRQTLLAYEQAILQALREVEDSLADYASYAAQREAQRVRVEAERKVLDLADMRYRGGVADYLEVLDAQRSLFSSELDESQAIGNHVISLIRLYKSLGGGWIEEAETEPESGEPPGAER